MGQTNRMLDADLAARAASIVIAANATTALDFGTPNDINLADLDIYKPGDRVVLVMSALRAAGSTSTLAFTIQDAADDGGAIGTPGTAVTAGTALAFAAGDSGFKSTVMSVKVRPGKPWLRINAVHGTAGTDSFQAHVTVLGVPNGV